METSILIAKLLGITYLVLGLGILFNTKYYSKLFPKFAKDGSFIFLGGILALLTGILMVSYHNIWEGSWRVIITIFGWLAVLKGLLYLLFPKKFSDLIKSFFKKKSTFNFVAFFAIVIGIVLTYFGYQEFFQGLLN